VRLLSWSDGDAVPDPLVRRRSNPSRPDRRRAGTIALFLAGVGALAGCSGGGGAERSSPPGSPAPTSTHATVGALPPGVTGATAVPTAVPNKPALRRDVTLSACSATPGGWAASGTARNPGKSSAHYKITVFFTTSSATVIGTAATHVTVPKGQTKPWTVRGSFTPAKLTQCILRGVG
jgi:hypothetical protein